MFVKKLQLLSYTKVTTAKFCLHQKNPKSNKLMRHIPCTMYMLCSIIKEFGILSYEKYFGIEKHVGNEG